MKKYFFVLVILFFTVVDVSFAENLTPTVQASPTSTATSVDNKTTPIPHNTGKEFYLGLGTGIDLPGNNWDPNYYVGSATSLFFGYGFDNNWGVLLDLEQDLYTGNGTNLYNFRGLIDIKYAFSVTGWQPYLLVGSGLVAQSLSPLANSTTNFDALFGAGVQFDVAPKTHLFIETKFNLILSQTTAFTDLPITAGVWVGF
jgi:Outer membrane protein beta-barrel domain